MHAYIHTYTYIGCSCSLCYVSLFNSLTLYVSLSVLSLSLSLSLYRRVVGRVPSVISLSSTQNYMSHSSAHLSQKKKIENRISLCWFCHAHARVFLFFHSRKTRRNSRTQKKTGKLFSHNKNLGNKVVLLFIVLLFTHILIYAYTRIYVYAHIRVYVYTHILNKNLGNKVAFADAYTYIRVYGCTCIRIYACIHIRIYVYTHIHIW